MSYDLILKTHGDIDASHFEVVQREIRESGDLMRLCEITFGRFGPGPIDVMVLEEALEFYEFSERDFAELCASRGLPVDRQNQESASAFLRSKYGLEIATFKLPAGEEETRLAHAEMVQLALRHKLRITNPQKGTDVDLERPGLLPPGWGV